MAEPRVLTVVDLANRTRFVTVDRKASVEMLRADLGSLLGVPAPLLRLTCAAKELGSGTLLSDSMLEDPVRVMLRVLGGKGGFGSMLRTSGKNGVKTTNFDACRDLNGRRLRHVNAESALREWEAQAEERKRKKLEKQARNAKPVPEAAPRFDDDEYEEMLETTRQSVSASVAAAVGAACRRAATPRRATAATLHRLPRLRPHCKQQAASGPRRARRRLHLGRQPRSGAIRSPLWQASRATTARAATPINSGRFQGHVPQP